MVPNRETRETARLVQSLVRHVHGKVLGKLACQSHPGRVRSQLVLCTLYGEKLVVRSRQSRRQAPAIRQLPGKVSRSGVQARGAGQSSSVADPPHVIEAHRGALAGPAVHPAAGGVPRVSAHGIRNDYEASIELYLIECE